MAGYRHFKVVVAGENAEELMLKYDSNIKVAPYPLFLFSEAEQYKENYIKTMQGIVDNPESVDTLGQDKIDYIKAELEDVKNGSASDFYLELTRGFERDKETMDVMTTANPDGKFVSHKIGGGFSLPFILNDGSEAYQARKKDIDWSKIHLANTRAYEVAWDTTHGLAEPQNDDERNIYENMKNMQLYFSNFEGREHYISSMTAFWGFAFVDNRGWHEIDGSQKQFDWVINFYERFIEPLPEDTLLTIYECNRPED